MFLKKTPKAKGTYLAITESYYDKEKKATRQKTIMGLGYLEDLKKDYPDPISHFEKVVADMNQEREAKKNSVVYVDLTTALSPGEHSLKNVGYGILKYLYKELQLDIFWRTRTWNLSLPYNIEELFRYMVISRALYPNCTWNEAIEKGIYFEESGSISDEDLDSAFHVIVKLQKDLQKWIYEHSGSILSRDTTSAFLDHTSYNFSIPGSMPSDTQPNARRTDSTLHLDLLTDRNGIPIAYDLSTSGTVLNQSVFNAVKQLKRENPRTRFYNTAPARPEEEPFICNGVPADGYIYGLPVHTANAEFKDWVLKDGYQEMKILNEKHQTIPLLYKERIFEDREKQFVYYHELQARQQRLARESSGRRTGLKLDGYTAIATDNLEADNLTPYRLFSGLRHMEKIFLDSKSQYDSSATFIWTPDKINAHFVIGFVSFTLMRMLQAKLDFQFSMEQIGTSLQRYNCVQIAGNIYQFTYYDVILDACEKALELELHNKYRSQLQIRRLLRY